MARPYKYFKMPRRASKMVTASAFTSGVTSPVSTDSATVTGSVNTSHTVAPAMISANTPTKPTRLKLKLPKELFRGRRAAIAVPERDLTPWTLTCFHKFRRRKLAR